MPRNRTRAEKRSAGLACLETWLTPEHLAAITSEADKQGVSRAGLVAKWAESLAKKHARKNRLAACK